MKSLTHTMIVLAVLNLAMGDFAFAQDSPGGKPRTYTISGSAGVPGVMMRGLPANPISDEQGRYSVTVERDWTGTVTPAKEGYTFEPQSRIYATLVADHTNDNYAAEAFAFTISGRVGLAGVLMMGLPGEPISNKEGIYRATVLYGWAGRVAPSKKGYTFMPPVRNYAKVAENLANEDYAPSAVGEEARAQYEDLYGAGYSAGRGGVRRSTGYQPPSVGPIGSRKVLVVPAEEVKPADLAAITEDMQVMSYILDERFKETRRIQGVFTDFGDFFGRDNRATEATYLQGYGVLFSMEVNFSFSPPPKPQAQETEPPGEQVDSTWQRAKQQVFAPGVAGAEGPGSPEEYNSQMVEELKRDLITTLKHAANIRGLQPDEWVILTVVGGRREFVGVFSGKIPLMGDMSMSAGSAYGGVSTGGMGAYSAYGSGGGFGGYGTGGRFVGGGVAGGYGGGMGMGGMGGYGVVGPSSSTVLTIRARKSDVDAFAKGEMTFEQFQEQVKILMY